MNHLPRRIGVACFLLALAAPGCVEENSATVLVPRAQFDLACPPASLHWVSLDDKTWGDTGCGKRATYVEVCHVAPGAWGEDCQWMMNSAANPAH